VRLGLDRALPLPAGRNVIAAGPSDAKPHRSTGVERSVGGADVLDLEAPEAEEVARMAPRRKRNRRDPAGTRFVVTLVRASEPLDGKHAAAVVEGWRRDPAEAQLWVGAALAAVNQAIRAHRLVERDAYAVEVTADDLLWAAVGCGPADVIGAGGVGEQLDALPRGAGRPSSSQRAKPGETMGLALTGALAMLEGEELVAFAVREANHGRLGSAAAALAAGRTLLASELDGRYAAALDRLPALAATVDTDALLDAAEDLQDVVDHWRSGRDAHDAPEVVRAVEFEEASAGSARQGARSGELPRA
jgi:hypothetical protein